MKQRGVTHMEVVFTAIAVFAAGVLLINKFVFEPEQQAEVTTEDRMKIQINALENKIKPMTGIEQRFQELEADVKKAWETLDHVQNLTENGQNFMKANEQEINNLGQKIEKTGTQIKLSLEKLRNEEVPNYMRVKLEEFKKPLAVALNQTRAQRPVRVTWKKGRKGWHMVDKTVEYSRAEYLKKLKKQRTPNASKN